MYTIVCTNTLNYECICKIVEYIRTRIIFTIREHGMFPIIKD